MTNLSAENRNSLLLLTISTVSTYLLIKGWRRLAESRRQGVLKLIIYPIKSISGIEVDQLEITPTGVRFNEIHDRAFILLNESSFMITLRTKPTLALIRPSFDGEDIVLEAPGMEQLRVSTSADCSGNQEAEFQIWGQNTKGVEYSKAATEWFTRFLKSEARLIKFQPTSNAYRKTDMHGETELTQDPDHPIVYQDECPVNLANQSSIDDLNSKLPAKNRVSYRNFRPNILVRVPGNAPFDEDTWRDFTVGTVKFSVAKPTHRCTTTLVRPDLGTKNPDIEPLETLKSYRIKDEWKHLYQSSPLFGLSLYPNNQGVVQVGDQVSVQIRILDDGKE